MATASLAPASTRSQLAVEATFHAQMSGTHGSSSDALKPTPSVTRSAAMTNLDWGVVLLYLVGLFCLGVRFSRQQSSTEEYFLAGRRLPAWLAGISALATLLSTVSYLAIPGETIRNGIGLYVSLLAFVGIIPVVNRVMIPFLMRLKVTSIYDYLQRRFGRPTRLLGASVFVITRFVWMGLILYTASVAINGVTGWRTEWLVVVMGAVTTIYTAFGGLRAVVWSDCLQFVLLFGGAVFIPIYIALQLHAGPATWWEVFSDAERSELTFFSFDFFERITVVGIILEVFVWNICTHGSDQVAAQRYISTPSLRAARRSVWVFSIANIALILLLVVCGLALFYFYYIRSGETLAVFEVGIKEGADKILPRFIGAELPAGVSGLLISALLAAAMSSLSSGVNSVCTVFLTDFVSKRDQSRGLAAPIWLSLVVGVASVAASIAIIKLKASAGEDWNLTDLIHRVNHLFVAPLGALFFAGIWFRRAGQTAVLCGFACGAVTGLLISFSREFFDLERHVSFTWIMPAGFAVTLVVTFACAFLFEPPRPSQLSVLEDAPTNSPVDLPRRG